MKIIFFVIFKEIFLFQFRRTSEGKKEFFWVNSYFFDTFFQKQMQIDFEKFSVSALTCTVQPWLLNI